MITMETVHLIIQIVTLIALIVYVVKTWEMASASKRAAEISEKTLQELKDTREEELAPYIVAYLDVPDNKIRKLYLIIKNTGKTMASNVTVKFTPPLQTKYPEMLERVLPNKGIPSISPNYEIRTVIDIFSEYKESGPMVYEVELVYFGGIDNKPRTTRYILDLWLHRGTMTANESS